MDRACVTLVPKALSMKGAFVSLKIVQGMEKSNLKRLEKDFLRKQSKVVNAMQAGKVLIAK